MGCSTPVAVRSSATAEDLPNASFAGRQDTYLNVIGTHAVLEAVRRCWASLWTERAIVYWASNGIDPRSVRLAVVIQSMVDAAVAGVLFTANPVTGRRRQAVIDASPGLGEAIVSGAVNPDHFEVDTPSLQILSRRIGDKRVEVQPAAGGGTRHVTLHAGSEQASITDRQIRELASLGGCVERHFGSPQDVEWAIDRNGKTWLTQSRPITTLFPVPEPALNKSGLRVYFCFSLAQGLHRPLTPMGLGALKLFGASAARLAGIEVPKPLDGPPVFKVAAQRIFFDVTNTLRGPVGRELMPRILDVMEARTAAILRSLLEDPRLSVVNPSRLPFLRRVAKLAIRYGIPLKVFRALVRPHAAWRSAHSAGDAVLARLHEPAGSTAIERLDFIERSLERELIGIMPATFPPRPPASACWPSPQNCWVLTHARATWKLCCAALRTTSPPK